MTKEVMCQCIDRSVLVDINNEHSSFKSKLEKLEVGNWVLLMSCPECKQLWKVDEWDKYQISYAVKVPTKENWEDFDSENLIKQAMIENRGGLIHEKCMWAGCSINRVKGSAYCVNHLYEGGTRA